MPTETVQIGLHTAALILIAGSIYLAFRGATAGIGAAFRREVKPLLTVVLRLTDSSPATLSARSLDAATVCAAAAIVVDRALVGAVLAAVLVIGRPHIHRAVAQAETPMGQLNMAIFDLAIGCYLMVALAQVLLTNYLMATTFVLVMITFSWPTDSPPGRRVRRFRPAPLV